MAPPTRRTLLLTRHGQSVYNQTERLGGDSPITEDGESYASLLPNLITARLASASCLDEDEDAACVGVWTSTLQRTLLTARHLPYAKQQRKALDEISAGHCDGMTYEQVAERMPDEYAARKRDKLGYRYPGGESYVDLMQRLAPVLAELQSGAPWAGAAPGAALCIVSHQAVLRVLYGRLMGVPDQHIPTLDIPLHTLIELTFQADGSLQEQRWPVDVTARLEQFPSGSLASPASGASSDDTDQASSTDDADEPPLTLDESPSCRKQLAQQRDHTTSTGTSAGMRRGVLGNA